MRRPILIATSIAAVLFVLYWLIVPEISDSPIRHEGIQLLSTSKQLHLAITQYYLDRKTTDPNNPPVPPTLSVLIKEGYIDRSFFTEKGKNREFYFIYFSPDMKPSDPLIEAFSDKGTAELKIGGDGYTFPWKKYEQK